MLLRTLTLSVLSLFGAPAEGSGAAAATASETAAVQSPASARDARNWVIGPLIGRRNYSVGMPLHPTPMRGGGFYIDLPRHPGSVHYVTFPHGSLAGKRRIVMRYRIEAAPGVTVRPSTAPQLEAIITPYFQRRGDNWSGRGRYETYRWYGSFATQTIRPGEHVLVAPLDGHWTAVQTSNARGEPEAFRAAVNQAGEVGFVLGGGEGFGKGVFATGPARLVVTEFRVE